MTEFREAQLVRIYLKESDHYDGGPLYERIVLAAKDHHMAGATVLRGPMGFGAGSKIHTAKVLQLAMDLPVVVEIIETPANVAAFLEAIEPMIRGILVTTEKVQASRLGREQGAGTNAKLR